MTKVLFFTGVPVDDAATLYRSGLVAQKLAELDYKIIFTSVAADFQKKEVRRVRNLSVLFLGQAHYFAKRPFSNRKRLGFLKTISENLKTCVRMSTILKQEKPDKVLTVTSMPVSLMVGLLSKILGFKTLIDIEDFVVGQMEAAGYSKFLVKVYGLIEKTWVKIFDKVAVCSHYLQERYPGSVLILNMVDFKFWAVPLRPAQRDFAGQRKIVFVGQMGPYHGQLEVLEAFAPLLKRNKDLTLTFIGGGERQNNLKFKIENLKLKKQVIMIGQVSQDKVKDLLTSCNIGVLPLWDTPVHQARHPLKLLEYLAAGLVVITNDVGETGRLIKDGENGLLCSAGNIKCLVQKVEMVLKSLGLAQKISKKATVFVKEFSVEKILPKWIEFLDS